MSRIFRVRRRALPPQPDLDRTPFILGPADAPVGCLLIHGFSGSPAEMQWLGRYLADRGVRVEAVRLAGHGTQPKDLTYVTWRDWLHSAAEGLERLSHDGRKVVVIGFSMGSLLAMHLCAAYPELVAGVAAISPPIFFRDRRIHLIPVVRHLIHWHRVRRASNNTDPQAHTRYISYRRYPLVAVDHLLDLMRATRKVLLDVRTPALIMHGMRDSVIHPKSARYLYKRIGSETKELVWWHNSGHGVVFDAERQAVWHKLWQFVHCSVTGDRWPVVSDQGPEATGVQEGS
jgi:carboxylesterase